MANGPELSDVEKAWLISIDSVLVQSTPQAHAVAAGKIVDLWDSGGPAFQYELIQRAAAWRNRQSQLVMMAMDQAGPCQQLLGLMGDQGNKGADTKPKTKRKPVLRRTKANVVVMPSRRQHTPVQQITDAEAKKFMELLDAEGIKEVFDPGVSILDDKLFRPPLIILDKVSMFYEDISPAYERGDIDRPWDPAQREPSIALAFDLALLVMLRERRWTWVISDRHFSRLPWQHPCKVTPTGRPGWKLITGLLSKAGLIEQRTSQTWRLTKVGKSAGEHAKAAWLSMHHD